jgi:endonuclease/exonuclease/phosphatase (EEP) superfamily protein YafD
VVRRIFSLGVLVGGPVLLLAVVALPVTLARLFGGAAFTPMPQLAAFATWGVIAWGLVVIGFLIVRWWWLLAVAVLALGLHVWWLVPSSSARDVAAAAGEPGQVPIRVLTVNVEYGQGDAEVVARWVRERRVDVLAVQELTPEFAQQVIDRVGAQLPFSQLNPDAVSPAGTGIWSRWPIGSRTELATRGFSNIQAVIDVPDTRALTVTAVHTKPPTFRGVPAWRDDMRTVAGAARRTEGPQIMMGDFNASRDHKPFREILDAGLIDCADAATAVAGPGFTWPMENVRLPAFVRIDHVLASPGSFAVAGVETFRIPGSDHRGVFAELAMTSVSMA